MNPALDVIVPVEKGLAYPEKYGEARPLDRHGLRGTERYAEIVAAAAEPTWPIVAGHTDGAGPAVSTRGAGCAIGVSWAEECDVDAGVGGCRIGGCGAGAAVLADELIRVVAPVGDWTPPGLAGLNGPRLYVTNLVSRVATEVAAVEGFRRADARTTKNIAFADLAIGAGRTALIVLNTRALAVLLTGRAFARLGNTDPPPGTRWAAVVFRDAGSLAILLAAGAEAGAVLAGGPTAADGARAAARLGDALLAAFLLVALALLLFLALLFGIRAGEAEEGRQGAGQ